MKKIKVSIKNISFILLSVSIILVCAICLLTKNKKELMEVSVVESNEVFANKTTKVDDEVSLGDTCTTTYGKWTLQTDYGNYISGTCSSTSEPDKNTSGTEYYQCSDNQSPGSSVCGSYIGSGCHKSRKWTRSKTTECTSCDAGKGLSNKKCDTCSAGRYSGGGVEKCKPCPRGTYSNENGASSCTTCDDGYITESNGATECTACGEGKTSDFNHHNCVCLDGYISDGDGGCTACPAGTTSDSDHKNCVCLKGYYKEDDGTCTICPKGYECSDGNKYLCHYEKYQDEKGKDSCKSCKDDYGEEYMGSADGTSCVIRPVNYIDDAAGGSISVNYYLDSSESAPTTKFVAYHADNGTDKWYKIKSATWTFTAGSSQYFSFSSNSPNATLAFSGVYGGSGDFTTYNYTVGASSISGGTTKSGSYTRYKCSWSESTINRAYKTSKPLRDWALYQEGCNFYDGQEIITNSSGARGYRYTKFYSRCCSLPPPQDFGGCYGDEPYIGIATETGWSQEDQPFKKNGKNLKYRYNNINNEDACKPMASGKSCTDKVKDNDKKEKTTYLCDGSIDITVNDSDRICTSSKESTKGSIYSVSCNSTATVGFDLGDDKNDSTSNKVKRGLGFKFAIGVKTVKKCKLTFDVNAWRDSYNKVMNRLNAVRSRNDSSFTDTALDAYKKLDSDKWDSYIKKLKEKDNKVEGDYTEYTVKYLYEQYNLAKELEGLVTRYNNYRSTLNELYDESSEVIPEYSINTAKNNVVIKYSNEGDVLYGDAIIEDVVSHDLGISWLKNKISNPEDYTWEKTKTVKMSPDKVYINKYGDEVEKESEITVDGGKKIYVGYNITTPQNLTLKMTVSGLAGNDSRVYNTCVIEIEKDDGSDSQTEWTYRPIDVSNPFINSDWKKTRKGKNWENDTYDFTAIIDEDIWKKKAVTSVVLSGDEISALHISNSKDPDSMYRGMCDIKKDNLEALDEKICTAVNKIK